MQRSAERGLGCLAVTVLLLSSYVVGQAEEEWLAVINSGNPPVNNNNNNNQPQQLNPRLNEGQRRIQEEEYYNEQDYQQQLQQQQQPQRPLQPQQPAQRPQQPPRPQQPRLPPPPQRQQPLPQRPQQPRRPAQRPAPVRQPLPPRRPNPPPPANKGILENIGDTVGGIIDDAKCKADSLLAENALNDERFVRAQLSCLKGGKCDEIGRKIKRIAPEILRDRCPPPCNECNKKQFRKIMSTLARKYPRELQQILKSLNG